MGGTKGGGIFYSYQPSASGASSVLPLLSLFSHFLAILKDVRRCQDQR